MCVWSIQELPLPQQASILLLYYYLLRPGTNSPTQGNLRFSWLERGPKFGLSAVQSSVMQSRACASSTCATMRPLL